MSAPGGARVDESARRTRTRERLLAAAYQLFSEHGINGTSIEAIADEAGFTRGAFYSNFGTKTELFFALIDQQQGILLESVRECLSDVVARLGRFEGKPSPDLLQELLADILDTQPKNRQWYLIHNEFRLLAMRDAEVAPRFLASTHAFHERLAEVIETAVRSAGLRFVLEPVHLTQLLLSQHELAMQEAILSGVEDPDRIAREIMMRRLPPLVHNLAEVIED